MRSVEDYMEKEKRQNGVAYQAKPEPGQLVEVRRRQWVVAETNAAGLNNQPDVMGVSYSKTPYEVKILGLHWWRRPNALHPGKLRACRSHLAL